MHLQNIFAERGYTMSVLTSIKTNPQLNVTTNGQFIVQRKIISDVYPNFPNVTTFKVYLYLCRSFEWKFMRIKKAKSLMRDSLNLSSITLNQSLNWLEQHYFIKRTNVNKHQMYQAELLTVPDYDPFTNTYYCMDIGYDTRQMKKRNHGFIMMPSEAITDRMLEDTATGRRDWSLLKLKVILLLYANCWLEYFGGVNPDVIRIDPVTHSVEVEKSFYYNVKASEKQVAKIIKSLIDIQYLKVVPVMFEKGIYIGDSKIVAPSTYATEKLILRPITLSQKKLYRNTKDLIE